MNVSVPLSETPVENNYDGLEHSSSLQFRTKASEVRGGVTTKNKIAMEWIEEGDDDGGGNAADVDTEILPLGDPILPLLLMLLIYAAWKWRRNSHVSRRTS